MMKFILDSESCPSCKSASNARPQMVDKNLETDRELMLEFEIEQEVPHNYEIGKTEHTLIDLIEQKRAADKAEKVKFIFIPKLHQFYIFLYFIDLPNVWKILFPKCSV